jgi:hypothetical protein
MAARGFIYLATPFTKFRGGPVAAASMAGRVAGQFVKAGIPIFSPIAHTVAIAHASHLDVKDGPTWLLMDAPLMDASRALIVYMADGWQESVGVAHEISYFQRRKGLNTVKYLEPDNLDPEYLRSKFAALAR